MSLDISVGDLCAQKAMQPLILNNVIDPIRTVANTSHPFSDAVYLDVYDIIQRAYADFNTP